MSIWPCENTTQESYFILGHWECNFLQFYLNYLHKLEIIDWVTVLCILLSILRTTCDIYWIEANQRKCKKTFLMQHLHNLSNTYLVMFWTGKFYFVCNWTLLVFLCIFSIIALYSWSDDVVKLLYLQKWNCASKK